MNEVNVSRETTSSDLQDEVVLLCSHIGVDCSTQQAAALIDHLDLVLEANKITNLTSIRSLEDGLVLHIQDSAVFARFALEEDHEFLDIGTGGGFPGIPYSILTGRSGILVDSTKKKIELVSSFIQSLGYDDRLNAVHSRIEELDEPSHMRRVVLARALTALPSLLELASQHMDIGDLLISSKGPLSKEEKDSGDEVARMVGLDLKTMEHIDLTNSYGQRTVLVYVKTSTESVSLPRATGRAQKRPLA